MIHRLKPINRICSFVAIAVVLMCAGGFAQEQSTATAKKPTVVVMPFEAKGGGIEQDDCDVVTEIFESEYARTGTAIVVNRSTLKKIQEEQKFQASDWSNNSKTAKLGEALNAQQLVSGQLRLFNNIVFVTVQVQDIKTLAVLASVNVRVKDTMELLDKIPSICDGLVAQLGGTAENAQGGEGSNKQYKIGDTGPGGGYVFYYSKEGFFVYDEDFRPIKVCHYLEVSKEEVACMRWCPDSGSSGCRTEMLKDEVGYGYCNTKNIIRSKHKELVTQKNCAAVACVSYKTDTTNKGEWFLPSKDELNHLYNSDIKGLVLMTSVGSWFWSSSCFSNKKRNCIYARNLSSGSHNEGDKENKNHIVCVRAVRAF